MNIKTIIGVSTLLLSAILIAAFKPNSIKKTESAIVTKEYKSLHDFVVKDIDGNDFDLSSLKGKNVLVVNVASKCGLTPQYEDLQKLYELMDHSTFEIIGFPANNFLAQEPGSSEDIKQFCSMNYGVTFPIMEKISVGEYNYKSFPTSKKKADKTKQSEIYKWLTHKKLNGVIDTEIKWNFHKFLIDKNGRIIKEIKPSTKPTKGKVEKWIAEAN